MTGQMQKMSDTLLRAVSMLRNRDTAEFEAALGRLGAEHATSFGVEPDHYLYIGHALTGAVRDLSGPLWAGSLSSAWIAVYQWVAAHMIRGAAGNDPVPGPDAALHPAVPAPGVPAQRLHARATAAHTGEAAGRG